MQSVPAGFNLSESLIINGLVPVMELELPRMEARGPPLLSALYERFECIKEYSEIARNSNNISVTYKKLVSGKIVFARHLYISRSVSKTTYLPRKFSIFCRAKGRVE